jgi:hypothetical protein
MMNVRDIKITLERMVELLRIGGVSDWAQALDKLGRQIEFDPAPTAAQILMTFGGVGSLNDIVLYKAGQPLIVENNEFDTLRSKLYALCRE